MNPTLRNVLAVLLGATVCIFLNGLLLGLMHRLNPPPTGFDPETPATYVLLQARHYVNPFIAHALPSLIGGLIAALVAASRKMTFALVVGGLHMLGGIIASFMIPAPVWYIVLDLAVAYLPMAWLGSRLATKR